ncbi:MAG: zinc ABC transporter substrate-binding protein [Armatimonadota bacterium]|nr:zinc ABC transporter substrate-binding protein [Armatimonadota bacterium]MDR7580184.1 zinc ABC transporter substrate-binding protein [Armatimonadota bacterium]MDR7615929.1 zinc ABC transporter substrate-binding protein [Armatimonadota bacterium]
MTRWAFGVVALLVAACAPRAPAPSNLRVVASFYPLAELVREVGGSRVEVRQLVPPGAEPHDYEPTPGDVAKLREARVFVYNGAGFEPWVEKLAAELPPDAVRVEATRGLPLVEAQGGEPDHEHDEKKTGQGSKEDARRLDPHVWLDPVLAQDMVDHVTDGLVRADAEGGPEYRERAAALKRRLEDLHHRYERALARCRTKVVLTSHAAFGYLARRYGLRLVSVAGVSPEAEPSPRRVRELVALARREGVRAVFAESAAGDRAVRALAGELGVPVLRLDPLERGPEEAGRRGTSYLSVMERNFENLVQGLGCR